MSTTQNDKPSKRQHFIQGFSVFAKGRTLLPRVGASRASSPVSLSKNSTSSRVNTLENVSSNQVSSIPDSSGAAPTHLPPSAALINTEECAVSGSTLGDTLQPSNPSQVNLPVYDVKLYDAPNQTMFNDAELCDLLRWRRDTTVIDGGLPAGIQVLGAKKKITVTPQERRAFRNEVGACDKCWSENDPEGCWFPTASLPCYRCDALRRGCAFNSIRTRERGKDNGMKKNYKRAVLVCNARQFVQSQRELAAAHQPTLISAASLALPIIQDGTTVSASTTCLPQQPPLLKHKSDIVSPSKSPGEATEKDAEADVDDGAPSIAIVTSVDELLMSGTSGYQTPNLPSFSPVVEAPPVIDSHMAVESASSPPISAIASDSSVILLLTPSTTPPPSEATIPDTRDGSEAPISKDTIVSEDEPHQRWLYFPPYGLHSSAAREMSPGDEDYEWEARVPILVRIDPFWSPCPATRVTGDAFPWLGNRVSYPVIALHPAEELHRQRHHIDQVAENVNRDIANIQARLNNLERRRDLLLELCDDIADALEWQASNNIQDGDLLPLTNSNLPAHDE